MRQKPFREHPDGRILECSTWRGQESVTVLDAQCRDQNWAYLVITADGRLMVTWPLKPSRSFSEQTPHLKQIDRVAIHLNPNVSTIDRQFTSKRYIPY